MFSKILEILTFTAERRVEKSFKFASPFLVTIANERGFGSAIGRFNESEEGDGESGQGRRRACALLQGCPRPSVVR